MMKPQQSAEEAEKAERAQDADEALRQTAGTTKRGVRGTRPASAEATPETDDANANLSKASTPSKAFLIVRRQKKTARVKDGAGASNSSNSSKNSEDPALPCPSPSPIPPQTASSCSDNGRVGRTERVERVEKVERVVKVCGIDGGDDSDAGPKKRQTQTPLSAANGVSLIHHRSRRNVAASERADALSAVNPQASISTESAISSPDKEKADREAGCGISSDVELEIRSEMKARIGRKAAAAGLASRETPVPQEEAASAVKVKRKRRTAADRTASEADSGDYRFGDDVLTQREIGAILRHNCTQTLDELGDRIRIRETTDRNYYIGRDAADADTDEALRAIARKYGASWGCVVWNKARVGCEYADYAAAEWLSLGALFENYAESLKSYLTTKEIINSIQSLCTRYFRAVHGPIEVPDMMRLQLFVFEIAERALDVPAFRSTMCLNAISVKHPDVVDAVLEMILPKNLREALREYEPLRASAYWREGTEPGREVIDELRAFWKSIVMPVPAQNEHGAQAEPARGGRR